MDEVDVPQTTLREQIETQIEAVEQEPEQSARSRDEAGRFAKEQAEPKGQAPQPPAEPPPQQTLQRPTTWKKEFLPLWDKMAAGQPLSPEEARKVLEYSSQRENEYKTGVSTYRQEALQAKELQEAIVPFMPELQAQGISPAAWIKQLGAAHYALHKGTPEFKLQVFRELAHQFNVPIGMMFQQPGQGPNPVMDLMGQVEALKQQLGQVNNWRTQQETQLLMGEINKVAQDPTKYPHFEAVRQNMAQLLETGLAQDLQSAYDMAVWQNPEVREQLLAEKTSAASQQAVVAKAKARAVSPRSSTPSGAVTSGAKDRRASLEEAFEQIGGRV